MLTACLMIDTDNTTFQYWPETFDAISGSIAIYILSVTMVNDISGVYFTNGIITTPLIGKERGGTFNGSEYWSGKAFLWGILTTRHTTFPPLSSIPMTGVLSLKLLPWHFFTFLLAWRLWFLPPTKVSSNSTSPSNWWLFSQRSIHEYNVTYATQSFELFLSLLLTDKKKYLSYGKHLTTLLRTTSVMGFCCLETAYQFDIKVPTCILTTVLSITIVIDFGGRVIGRDNSIWPT